MIDITKNVRIQVKISKSAYSFIKKYSSMFDVSMSRFCEMCINDKICKIGQSRGEIDEYGHSRDSQ